MFSLNELLALMKSYWNLYIFGILDPKINNEKEPDANQISKSFDELQLDQMPTRNNLFAQRYLVCDTPFDDIFDRDSSVGTLKTRLLLSFSDEEDSSSSDDNFNSMTDSSETLFKEDISEKHIPYKDSLSDTSQLDLDTDNFYQHNNSLDSQQKGIDYGPCIQSLSADTVASNSAKKLDVDAKVFVTQSNLNINSLKNMDLDNETFYQHNNSLNNQQKGIRPYIQKSSSDTAASNSTKKLNIDAKVFVTQSNLNINSAENMDLDNETVYQHNKYLNNQQKGIGSYIQKSSGDIAASNATQKLDIDAKVFVTQSNLNINSAENMDLDNETFYQHNKSLNNQQKGIGPYIQKFSGNTATSNSTKKLDINAKVFVTQSNLNINSAENMDLDNETFYQHNNSLNNQQKGIRPYIQKSSADTAASNSSTKLDIDAKVFVAQSNLNMNSVENMNLDNEHFYHHNNSLDNQQSAIDDGPCLQKSAADTAASNSSKKLDIDAEVFVAQSNLNMNSVDSVKNMNLDNENFYHHTNSFDNQQTAIDDGPCLQKSAADTAASNSSKKLDIDAKVFVAQSNLNMNSVDSVENMNLDNENFYHHTNSFDNQQTAIDDGPCLQKSAADTAASNSSKKLDIDAKVFVAQSNLNMNSVDSVENMNLDNENFYHHNNSFDNQQTAIDNGPCLQKSSADTAASNSSKKLDINAKVFVAQSILNINSVENMPSKILQKEKNKVHENDGTHLGKLKYAAPQQTLSRYSDPPMGRLIQTQNQLYYVFPHGIVVNYDDHYLDAYSNYYEPEQQYYEDENPPLNDFELSNTYETDFTVDQVNYLQNNSAFVITSEQQYDIYTSWERMRFMIELYNIPKNYSTNGLLHIYTDEPRYVKWCDDHHALLITCSSIAAHRALFIRHPIIRSRAMINASPIAIMTANKHQLTPAGSQRPRRNYPNKSMENLQYTSQSAAEAAQLDEIPVITITSALQEVSNADSGNSEMCTASSHEVTQMDIIASSHLDQNQVQPTDIENHEDRTFGKRRNEIIKFVMNKPITEDRTVPPSYWNNLGIDKQSFTEMINKNFKGPTTIALASHDYTSYGNMEQKMEHIIELYNIPKTYKSQEILSVYKEQPCYIKWCDDTQALLVTGSPEQAKRALSINDSVVKSMSLIMGSHVAIQVALENNFIPAKENKNQRRGQVNLSAKEQKTLRQHITPRYIGDLQPHDFETPNKAKRNLEIVKIMVAKQRQKIQALNIQKSRSKKQIRSLKKLFADCKKNAVDM